MGILESLDPARAVKKLVELEHEVESAIKQVEEAGVNLVHEVFGPPARHSASKPESDASKPDAPKPASKPEQAKPESEKPPEKQQQSRHSILEAGEPLSSVKNASRRRFATHDLAEYVKSPAPELLEDSEESEAILNFLTTQFGSLYTFAGSARNPYYHEHHWCRVPSLCEASR